MGEEINEVRTTKRFRFMAAWETVISFKELIKTKWNNQDVWPRSIASLTSAIMEWNRSTFGNINLRKRVITRRLNGIDKANPYGTNNYLNQLQENL